jgi:hypothetical protein
MPAGPGAVQAKHRDPRAVGRARARTIVDDYFSRDHLEDREGCCPLIGVPSDLARGGGAAKSAYQEVVETLIEVFQSNLNQPEARDRALAFVALCVGGMVLARAVDDPVLADEFRLAACKQALDSTGWSRSARQRAPHPA